MISMFLLFFFFISTVTDNIPKGVWSGILGHEVKTMKAEQGSQQTREKYVAQARNKPLMC